MPDLQIRNAQQSTADMVETVAKRLGRSKSRVMEDAIRQQYAPKPGPLFDSGDPEWARKADSDMEGFGEQ